MKRTLASIALAGTMAVHVRLDQDGRIAASASTCRRALQRETKTRPD
ncbi:MAG: hypothetical protein ABSH03_13660 [Candidatus Lustribacter sp.]